MTTCAADDQLQGIQRDVSDIKSMLSRLSRLFDPMKMSRTQILAYLVEMEACGTDRWTLFAGRFCNDQFSLTEHEARKMVEEYLLGEEE